MFKNYAYLAGFWVYKAGLFIAGINGAIPDRKILGF